MAYTGDQAKPTSDSEQHQGEQYGELPLVEFAPSMRHDNPGNPTGEYEEKTKGSCEHNNDQVERLDSHYMTMEERDCDSSTEGCCQDDEHLGQDEPGMYDGLFDDLRCHR
jgi:hypothetical protein